MVVCRSIVSDVVCPLDRVLQILVAEPPQRCLTQWPLPSPGFFWECDREV